MKTSGWVAAAAGTSAAVALMTYAVRGRSATWLAPSVYRGARTRRSIALTFDDGPSEATPELLEILKRFNVKATFFLIGENVRRLPEVAQAIAGAGHEIGNHSDTHPMFCFHSRAGMLRELGRAQATIAQVTGSRPRYFRAPYGVRWFGMREAQRRFGLMGVMWTVIGVDWNLPTQDILRRLLNGAKPGAILCLHDGRKLQPRPDVSPMLRAVEQATPVLRERGFQFETISEILCPTTK